MQLLDSKMKRAAAGAGLAVLALAIAIPLVRHAAARSRQAAAEEPLTFAARRGRLVISVTENGAVRARDQVIIKSSVEGATTILYLIPEGQHVKKGDLLVELDASAMEQDKFDKELKLQSAEAAFVRAREDLAITKSQAESDEKTAELKHEFARLDLTKYREGDFPQSLRESQSNITLADEEGKRAAEKLKWSTVLYEEKYISLTEMQADDLAVRKATLQLDLAREALNVLTNYTHRRKMAELESGVTQTRMEYERTQRKGKASVVQAEADFTSKESEFKRQQEKMEELKKQIAATKIYAPEEGQVIYVTSVHQDPWHQNEPLAEGQQVRERQELIYLPSTDRMMAVIRIHESSLKKVHGGMAAQITLDALPGKTLRGRVDRIAPLPNASSSWMNPDLKVYDTQVMLEEDCPDLRSGMNCIVEIIVEDHPDAISVPIQSVVRIKDVPTVFVRRAGRVEQRTIQVGLDNNRMIHVLAGLSEGEEVLLAPPLDKAEATRSNDVARAAAPGAAGQAAPAAAGQAPAGAEGGRRGPRGGGGRSGGGQALPR